MGETEKVYGNLLRSIQSAIDFFDLLAGLGKRRMDGAAVGCRYFGLGDDRPYFHPPTLLHPLSRTCSSRVCVYVPTCIRYLSCIRELSDRFYVRSNDRLFEPTGNSLTAAFHRRNLPPPSSFSSLSISLALLHARTHAHNTYSPSYRGSF